MEKQYKTAINMPKQDKTAQICKSNDRTGIVSCTVCTHQNECPIRNELNGELLSNSHFDYGGELFEQKPSAQERMADMCGTFERINDPLFY